MDWMKFLNKGWKYVTYTLIVVTITIIGVTWYINGSGNNLEESNREIIEGIRDNLDTLEEENRDAVDSVDGFIENTELIDDGVTELGDENKRARVITEQIAQDNKGYEVTIRYLQDRTLECEILTDEIKRIIREVESSNRWSR